MYDIEKEKHERQANMMEVEKFIDNNPNTLEWFATSAGLLKGYIGTFFSSDNEKTIDISQCEFMSINPSKKIERFAIKPEYIFGWGLDNPNSDKPQIF